MQERKLVTVLYADIVGSTTLTGQHDPEVVREALDRASYGVFMKAASSSSKRAALPWPSNWSRT